MEEPMQEAEIVSEKTTTKTTATMKHADSDNDNHAPRGSVAKAETVLSKPKKSGDDVVVDDDSVDDDNDDEEENVALDLNEWFRGDDDDDGDGDGKEKDPVVAVYQKIINTARLTAEMAYERHDAMVGALAEAGGDEGAAERWLLGFLTLMHPYLPSWWWSSPSSSQNQDKSDTTTTNDDDNRDGKNNQKNDSHHRKALLALANNRRGDYFIKRSLDELELRKRMGMLDFAVAEVVAMEVLFQLVPRDDVEDQNDPNDDALLGNDQQEQAENPAENTPLEEPESPAANNAPLFPLNQDSLAEAKTIWGEETMAEFYKKSKQEEKEMRQAEKAGLVSKVEGGQWWGPAATSDAPEQAYHRLLDAARYGCMLAYEKEMRAIGGIADALQESKQYNVGSDDFDYNADMEENDENMNEQGVFSDSTADTAEKTGSDDDGVDMEDIETKEEVSVPSDTVYSPTELGPNAKYHFEEFLEQIKKANLMPPWWNDEHEAALWRLASDVKGEYFLGHCVDGDDMKEMYNGGVRHKIGALAEAASLCSENESERSSLGDSMYALKGMKDEKDVMSDVDSLLGPDEDADSSKGEHKSEQ